MQGLEDLYREVILDHYRAPHGSEPVPDANASAEGFNPLCGDELVLRIRIEEDRIAAVEASPKGCSISVAAASMMAESIVGLTLVEAAHRKEIFKAVMRGEAWPEGEDFGDLEALEGVRNFPVRIKCALLAWMTLEQILVEKCPGLSVSIREDDDIEVRSGVN